MAETNGKKYITWQSGLVTTIAILAILLPLLWTFHCNAKSELQKGIDTKVDKDKYSSDISRIELYFSQIKGELETLNALHPRAPRGNK